MAKRPHLDSKKMRPVYERYKQSGQTIKAFCKAEQINPHTFNYWRLKFIREVPLATNSFQQVRPTQKKSTAVGVIKIRVANRIEIDLPVDYDPAALHQLIQELTC
jgi:transposase-like protein